MGDLKECMENNLEWIKENSEGIRTLKETTRRSFKDIEKTTDQTIEEFVLKVRKDMKAIQDKMNQDIEA